MKIVTILDGSLLSSKTLNVVLPDSYGQAVKTGNHSFLNYKLSAIFFNESIFFVQLEPFVCGRLKNKKMASSVMQALASNFKMDKDLQHVKRIKSCPSRYVQHNDPTPSLLRSIF